jgi:stage II sporulation protein AB (anti-sigma F factor)
MERIVENQIKLEFLSRPENVALCRIAVASLASQREVTLNDLEEIKVAISEAVSNSIIHGYQNRKDEKVTVIGTLLEDELLIEIIDEGVGIANVKEAMQPAYSTDPERMGLGFVFMRSFMDQVEVESQVNQGTKVKLLKKLNKTDAETKAVS